MLVNVWRTPYTQAERTNAGAFTSESLGEVRDLVADEAPQAAELLGAVDETLDGEKVYSSRGESGRRLIAAIGPDRSSAIEALMYAEGDGPELGRFSAVRVGIWISQSTRLIPRATHLHNGRISEDRRSAIRRELWGLGLENWDEHYQPGKRARFWGLPVSSTTKVTPSGTQDGDIQVPFYYGNWRDVLAVSGLDVSDSLREMILTSVLGEHAREQLAAGHTPAEVSEPIFA